MFEPASIPFISDPAVINNIVEANVGVSAAIRALKATYAALRVALSKAKTKAAKKSIERKLAKISRDIQRLTKQLNKQNSDIKNLANNIGDKYNGTVRLSSNGKGYNITIPNKNNPITLRLMQAGGKPPYNRTNYARISTKKQGALSLDGKPSNLRERTHIPLNKENVKNLQNIIERILE